jgi:protocatechuate 3,4-dioxygenase beta subunit
MTCLVLLLTFVATGAELDQPATPPASTPETPVVERTTEPVPGDGLAISVQGVVLATDNKPVKGATVVLRAKQNGFYPSTMRHGRDIFARTRSDPSGRFAFNNIVIPVRFANVIDSLVRGRGEAEVLAWADGLAITWTDVKRLTGNEPVRLVLVPEARVTGLVRDKNGKGIAHGHIVVFGASRAAGEADGSLRQPGDLNVTRSEVSLDAATDGDGRIRFHHLPPDYRIGVEFAHPGMARQIVYVDTGNHRELTEVRGRGPAKVVYPVLHPPLNIVLEPTRSLTIRVVDETGQPVRQGGVELSDAKGYFAGEAFVDDRGEARIALPGPGRYRIHHGGADPLQPTLDCTVTAEIPAGNDTPLVEIRLPRCTWLTGQVVDANTGRGIAGAYVSCVQTRAEDPSVGSLGVSGRDGEFRIPVVAGKADLSIAYPVYGYVGLVGEEPAPRRQRPRLSITVPASGDPRPVRLSLSRGLGFRGIVRGPEGKPLSGALVQADNVGSRSYRKASARTDAAGRFELSGLSPFASAALMVVVPGGIAQLSVPGSSAEEPLGPAIWKDVEMQLKPAVSVTGRVLHKDQPRPGVVLELFRMRREGVDNRRVSMGEGTTDAQGRYRIGGLEAGDRYSLEVVDSEGMMDPGWGRVGTVPAGKPEITLPDVHLVTCGQSLRGIVVDPQGKPVKGSRVVAKMLNGRFLSGPRQPSRPRPWTETDDQGRFELRQLPDQPLELMATQPNPLAARREGPPPRPPFPQRGVPIRHPAYVRPSMNQQDIRIVLDPTLDRDIEDLDAPKRPSGKKQP